MECTYNPIRDIFEGQSKPIEYSDIRWPALGADKSYIILFTGRSGSTLLTKLLESSGLCGNPEEFFSESYIGYAIKHIDSRYFKDYFEHIVRSHTRNGYFGFEIDAQRYFWVDQLVNLTAAITSNNDIPVIWLTREDFFSQAYSFAMAKTTGLWHRFNEEEANQAPNESDPQAIDDEKMIEELIWLLQWEQEIENIIAKSEKKPLRITYEQLAGDGAATISRVLTHIGLDITTSIEATNQLFSDSPGIYKMRYNEKLNFLTDFFIRYADAHSYIQENRRKLDLTILSDLLTHQK